MWRPKETLPEDEAFQKRGFLAAIIIDGEVDAIEWLGAKVRDGRWNLNSHNITKFEWTHWATVPETEDRA